MSKVGRIRPQRPSRQGASTSVRTDHRHHAHDGLTPSSDQRTGRPVVSNEGHDEGWGDDDDQ